jgi:3-hydroxyacyl-CoA dehydrogenase
MDKLMEKGVLGNKTGRGFFWKDDDKVRHTLDPVSGDYEPESDVQLPSLGYIDDVSQLHNEGRYRAAMQVFLAAEGDEANLAKKVVAGYVSYAFHRVGEVTESIDGIDRIMGMGFNWAPPSVLVDTLGIQGTVEMIEKASLPVPEILAEAARTGKPKRFFNHARINVGRFFVAG